MPFFDGLQTRDYFLISNILYVAVFSPNITKATLCFAACFAEKCGAKKLSSIIELLTGFERYLYCETSEVNKMSHDRELIEMLQGEMRTGFTMLAAAIGQTNAKLDQTIEELHEFRSEVNTKLSGISSLMLSSERNVGRLEKRIVKLEDRMNQFEDKPRPPTN